MPDYAPLDPDPPLLWTAVQAARALGVTVKTVRRLVAAGRLPVIRFGERGLLRFRPDDVEALLEPVSLERPSDGRSAA